MSILIDMDMSRKKERKQLMFDLETKVCAQILGRNYRKVYDDIERYLVKNGFTHLQGSGYVSEREFSDRETVLLLRHLIAKYPYLSKCFRDIRTADITSLNSINHHFDYDGTPGRFKMQTPEQEQIRRPPGRRR